jgi:hypothetical protein
VSDLSPELSVVAALYVETGGVYFGLPDVEPWDTERNALLYDGPWSVVAHPPCASWSAWAGMREAVYGRPRGEDGGCFAHALDCLHRFGGVLEHPAHSRAWQHFGLPEPSVEGVWCATVTGEWVCALDQAAYGLHFNKHTWLCYVGVAPPLPIRPIAPTTGRGPDDVWSDVRSRTPLAFRDALLDLARSAQPKPPCAR